MKKFFVLLCAVSLLFLGVSWALAAGYNDPLQYTSGTGPHGGYTTTTNKCKECHAVHLATGSYRLLRSDDAETACDFCHGATGVIGTTNGYVLDTEGHGLSVSQQTGFVLAPDDTSDTAYGGTYQVAWYEWGCPKCHSVHNTGTTKLADRSTTMLLKANPVGRTTYKYYTAIEDTSTETLSEWCSACHQTNFGLHTDSKNYQVSETTNTPVYGHDVSATGQAATYGVPGEWTVDPGDASNQGPTCKQCHVSDGTGSDKFPHASGSTLDMLKAGMTDRNTMDSVCLSCHATTSMP